MEDARWQIRRMDLETEVSILRCVGELLQFPPVLPWTGGFVLPRKTKVSHLDEELRLTEVAMLSSNHR